MTTKILMVSGISQKSSTQLGTWGQREWKEANLSQSKSHDVGCEVKLCSQ